MPAPQPAQRWGCLTNQRARAGHALTEFILVNSAVEARLPRVPLFACWRRKEIAPTLHQTSFINPSQSKTTSIKCLQVASPVAKLVAKKPPRNPAPPKLDSSSRLEEFTDFSEGAITLNELVLVLL
ncbi:hypothetical protein O181_073697, partial [Austropuccinia psidii MF-1]|nr:hypothetical protein [Austropuccinia psidii MF-1]